MKLLIATIGIVAAAAPALAQPFAVDWTTIEPGSFVSGGTFELVCVVSQPDAGPAQTGGTFALSGGFLLGAATPGSCYANCDGSTAPPVLNTNDFQCFLNKFAAGESYANCDGSTAPPVLNTNDFQCFLNKFAAGCS